MVNRTFNGYLADEIKSDEIKTTPHEEIPTKAQLKVINFLSHGFSTEMIAEELSISVKTVANHIEKARTRMGTKTRGHLIAKAIRRGLI